VIAEPPLLAGAVKLITALWLPRAALPIAGAPGTVAGMMLPDAPDAAPVPALLVAVTVNVYAVPLDSPLTVIGLVAPVPVKPPGLEVTV
jgi:hypothetical protein